ncbi:hypothetical protein RvY_16053 [Ramazzottius varieornatus]|uniref:GH18 domain-containing protein n=1 Tax=Ramazzottius varieornatus TaxID=947166 RepID=A0A1D1VX31_RAMVA|nr:hypothetical protein RvY_16053 [Ramazzottius varieornatus]
MFRIIVSFAALCGFWIDLSVAETVTCVYQSYAGTRRLEGRLMGDEIPAEYCTHLVYTYASIYQNKIFTQLPSLDEYTDGGYGNLARFAALKQRNPQLKVLIGVGGWVAGGWIFSNMAQTPEGRQEFIQSVQEFCAAHNFDGIFIDWLYPAVGARGGAPDDLSNFASLLTEMRATFDEGSDTSLFIGTTVASAPDYLANYNAEAINNAADLVYVITYDLAGYWNGTITHPSPLFSTDIDALSVDSSIRMWQDAGIDSSKLVLGIPFFARTYRVPNNPAPAESYGGVFSGDGHRGLVSQAPGFLWYFETCSRIALAGYTVVRDQISSVPYAYSNDNLIMYEDVQSVQDKARYARTSKLSGVYLFSIDQDDIKGFCGTPFPLTQAAASVLLNSQKSSPTSSPSQVRTERRNVCASSSKQCQNVVQCLIYPNVNTTVEVCAKDVRCTQPEAILECPVLDNGGKDLSRVTVGDASGGSLTQVVCRDGSATSGNNIRGGGNVAYVCTEGGFLGQSLVEYTCPQGTNFSPKYLKCLLGGSEVATEQGSATRTTRTRNGGSSRRQRA